MSLLVHVPTYVLESLPRGAVGRSLLRAVDDLQRWDGRNLPVEASHDYTFWSYYPDSVPGWQIDFYIEAEIMLVVFRVGIALHRPRAG